MKSIPISSFSFMGPFFFGFGILTIYFVIQTQTAFICFRFCSIFSVGFRTIRISVLFDRLGSVPGVQFVTSLLLIEAIFSVLFFYLQLLVLPTMLLDIKFCSYTISRCLLHLVFFEADFCFKCIYVSSYFQTECLDKIHKFHRRRFLIHVCTFARLIVDLISLFSKFN